jgi:hypothetical protein
MSSLPIEEHYARSEVFTAVTMKNGDFWDVRPCARATWHNIPEDTSLHSHRCENLKSYFLEFVRCEVFMAVTMKNVIFWDVTMWVLLGLTFERNASPPSSG